ncbi:MAG: 3-oxoacyl-[acyl-carrier-protein] reductase [Acidobacteriaceae bacterium]
MTEIGQHVALVTGASQGIGRACAQVLAAAGHKVALAARNEEKLAAVVNEIREAGGDAQAFTMNVSSEEQIKAGVKAIQGQLGKLDILVNNAGLTRDGLMMRMKRADWDDVIATNLTAAFLLIQAAMPGMLKQRWGRIINITSVVGQTGQAGQVNYASSKAGLIGLTMSVARELASRNITCNAIAPGFIETAMTHGLSDEQKKAILQQVPLGRYGSDMDIAHAVNFLASEEAGYITGHTLAVNGGMYMG